jgi:hypothetical protein
MMAYRAVAATGEGLYGARIGRACLRIRQASSQASKQAHKHARTQASMQANAQSVCAFGCMLDYASSDVFVISGVRLWQGANKVAVDCA